MDCRPCPNRATAAPCATAVPRVRAVRTHATTDGSCGGPPTDFGVLPHMPSLLVLGTRTFCASAHMRARSAVDASDVVWDVSYKRALVRPRTDTV